MKGVDAAITSRRSVRAFLPTPVPRETIEAILEVSRRAPSGTNMQPWRAYVLTGATKARLSGAIHSVFDDPTAFAKCAAEHRYYPAEWFSPYIDRRRKLGWDLYATLGIQRGENDRMHHQHGRNYDFFDAPVGIIFTIDRRLEVGSWLDYGMFLGNVMTAARGRGLDTCPQAAFLPFHETIREVLAIDPSEAVVCGMSLGYADESKPENTLVTVREPVAAFTSYRD